MSAATPDLLSGERKSLACRRKHRRESLTWALVYVEFGQDNGGIALNLGEHGVSVQAAMPLVGDEFPDMRLKGGCDRGWTPVIGRLAWIGENRKTAGIEFVDLSADARRRIASWIALEHPSQVTERPANATAHRPNEIGNPTSRSESKLPPVNGRSNSNAASNNQLFGFDPTPKSPRGQKYWYRQRRPRAKLIPENWNLGATAIIVLGALLFGAGLMLGAGLLGRMTRVAKDLSTPQAQQVAENTDSSKALEGQSAVTTPDNSLAKLLTPPASTTALGNPQHLSHSSVEGLPSASNNLQVQTPAPQQAAQGEPVTRRDPVESPKAANPPNSSPARATLIAERAVGRAASSAPASSISIPAQPIQPLPQSAPPTTTPLSAAAPPTDSAHPQNDLHATNAPTPAPAAGVATPPPIVDPAAATTQAPAAQPEEHRVAAVAPLGRMEPGHLLHSVQPIYPPDAKKQHLEGNVQLRLVVGTDGNVRSIQLVSGAQSLASAAINAARQFRYSPAFLNGQPIEAIQTIDMSFSLKN